MLFKQIILLLIISLVFSCKTPAPLVTNTNTTKTITVKEVVVDTFIKTVKDSTSYKALLKCQDGKVVFADKPKTPTQTPEGLQLPDVSVDNNYLTVYCIKKAEELFLQWKLQHESEVIETIKEIPYPVEKSLSFWQLLFIGLGKVSIFILLALAIRFILKIKNII